MNHKLYIFIALSGVVLFSACQKAGGNKTGSEYMPDMYHSIAYEANTYTDYSYNTWDDGAFKRKDLSQARLPVKGSIPRGYAAVVYAKSEAERQAALKGMYGETYTNTKAIPINGHVPYYYGDTEEERTRASNEILMNPYPITQGGLERGKELYNVSCGICHGEKADGNGYLVSEENVNAKYPAQPTSFLTDDLINSTNGRYYHAIHYGRNLMGSYKDKLSYEERWQVIHYIRSLQAKSKNLEYSHLINTLNTGATPAGPDMAEDEFAKKVIALLEETPTAKDAAPAKKTLELENVFFDTGKTTLKSESQTELNKLFFVLGQYPDVKIEVSGHTDSDGEDAANLKLSQGRAEAVKNYLVSKGIDGKRLLAKGYGETVPVASNDSEEGKAQNRRTEFTVLGQ